MKKEINLSKIYYWMLPVLVVFSIASCKKDNSLGFTPESHDGQFHKLEVKVKRPGMKPASRNGYYAR